MFLMGKESSYWDGDGVSNNNQWEAMLQQHITNYTEFKFSDFKRKKK